MITFLQYISEVKQGDLKKIGKSLNAFNKEGNLHLDNIFGTKKRIAFPINTPDKHLTSFMDELQDLGIELSADDLKKGIITKQIQTQRGIQDRHLRIATYLNSLKKAKGDKIDQIVQNWSIIKDRLDSMDMKEGYSVIVSRYPLDILRMSDHVDDDGGEIESCHSPDGGWYHCAIKEAHIGGAVAYAVKTTDLAKIDLQAKEIFRDKDRAISGIFPLERVRLRRFHNEQKKLDILVPEIRTYPMKSPITGIKRVSGFHEAVVEWAKKVQAREIASINPEEDYDDFDLRGGAYQDNKTDVIWSDFFGVSVDGEKNSKDQLNDPEGKMTAERWEEMAEDFVRQHRFQHVEVEFHGHDDGQNHAWGRWEATLEFEWNAHKVGFTKMPDRDIFRSGYHYNQYATSPEKSREFSLLAYMQELFNDITYVGLGHNSFLDNYIRIKIELTDPDDGRHGDGQLHQFEHFLDRMSRVDNSFNSLDEHLLFWFTHNGYINNPVQKVSNSYTFRHFTVEASAFKKDARYGRLRSGPQINYEIASEWIDIGDLKGISRANLNSFNFLSHAFQIQGYPITGLPQFAQNHLLFKSNINLKLMLSRQATEADRILAQFNFVADYTEEQASIKKTLAGVSVIDRDWHKYVEILQHWWSATKVQMPKLTTFLP